MKAIVPNWYMLILNLKIQNCQTICWCFGISAIYLTLILHINLILTSFFSEPEFGVLVAFPARVSDSRRSVQGYCEIQQMARGVRGGQTDGRTSGCEMRDSDGNYDYTAT